MGTPLRSWAIAATGDGARWSHYREFPPAPAVAAVATGSWQGRAGWARSLRVLPDGCADLLWDGQELTVAPAVAAPLRRWLPASARTVGVRLRCGALGGLLGRSAAELPAGALPLRDLLGAPARHTEELLADCASQPGQRAILQELLAARLRADHMPDPVAVAAARSLWTAGPRIEDTAGRLGVSERALRRRLGHAVGLSPKRLHRVLRLQRFLRQLPALAQRRTELAAVAVDLGYADQSHLGRDCRELAGATPAGLLRSWTRQDRMAETFQTAAGRFARMAVE